MDRNQDTDSGVISMERLPIPSVVCITLVQTLQGGLPELGG